MENVLKEKTIPVPKNILEKKEYEYIQKYTYRINPELAQGEVTIIFVNEKFSHCAFPFNGQYAREEWHVLQAINEKITELENNFKKNKK